jgi:flagellar hook-associated protein 2
VFLPPATSGGAGTLVLTRRQTGASPPAATVSGPQLSGESIKAGADASVTVDGTAYTSSSNVVTTALPGVELTLKDLGSTTVSVSAPAPDPAAVKAKLQAFVDQYNQTVDLIRSKVSEKRVVDAATTTDAKKGVLFADTQLTGLLSRLRSIVADSVTVPGSSIKSVLDLGISTGTGSGGASSADALAGKLTIDDAKLTDAIANRRTDVRAFLGDAAQGLAARLTAVLDPVAKVGGLMDSRADESGREIKRMDDELVRMDARLTAKQDSLKAQYAALETALAQAQQQGSWLSGQLAGLSG